MMPLLCYPVPPMTTAAAPDPPRPRSTPRADSPRTLGVISLSRFALNLQHRVVYPFLPAISRGLGVSLETAGLLLTVRALVGATAPLYGLLADRLGRRTLMLAGLAALIVGSTLVGLAPTFAVALVAFAVLGLGKASYDPAMQAYVGDAVPYARRGRVLGFLELSWALSLLIGVPAAGFMIAALGWRAPFWAIAGLGVVSLLATRRVCPGCGGGSVGDRPERERGGDGSVRDRPEQRESWPERGRDRLKRGLRGLLPAAAPLAVTGLLMFASDNVFIVYGALLENRFGLAVSAVGIASSVIAVAELIAEGSAAGIVDHLGKRRVVLGGLLLNFAAYLLLPRLAGSLAGALIGMALIILAFEFSVVSLLPLVSEAAPEARGTVMALNTAAMAAGRVISSLTGPRLWAAGGLAFNTSVSAAVVVFAAVVVWWKVRERTLSTKELE